MREPPSRRRDRIARTGRTGTRGRRMKIGAIFPHDTIEPDFGAIRTYVRGVEEMGFSHILSYDHVIGANRASRPGWQGYDLDSKFHEPIALLFFISGITS